MLALYLDETTTWLQGGWKVIDIAPKRTFREYVGSHASGFHVGVNLSASSVTDLVTDLTGAGIRSGAFDLAVCFHVLEHIPDDVAAMRELHRMLKPNGTLLVQVPLNEDCTTEEDPDASEDERLRRFGKTDHVRTYGLDIVARLESVGFRVEVNRPREWLPHSDFEKYALAGDDQVLFVASA